MYRTPLAALYALSNSEPERLQARVLAFFDLETTGIGSTDRLVSFGGVKLRLEAPGEIAVLHLVFNPQCECTEAAAWEHGYSARELALQDSFDGYAKPLRQWFDDVDLVVANAAFELRFLRDAFARAGAPDLDAQSLCAMWSHRPRGARPATLEAIAARLGLARGVRHGALRDAWACMQAFLKLQGLPWRFDYELCGDSTPANYRAPAPSFLRAALARPDAPREARVDASRRDSSSAACAVASSAARARAAVRSAV
jgi:DNA polymerase III epsilon subunit-like protein